MTPITDIITRLRALELNASDEAAELILRLTAERDEARQMYCNAIPENCDEHEAKKIAWERGWDCFKEEGK